MKISTSIRSFGKLLLFFAFYILFYAHSFSQKKITDKLPFEKTYLQTKSEVTAMPYNRLIESAGKVITFGDPNLENHALDVCALPGKKQVVIEDLYGIAVADIKTSVIIARWSFPREKKWENLMSTYAGITSFIYNDTTFIAWSAAGKKPDRSSIMIASWDGKKITGVTAISFNNLPPAERALPNQVIANTEDNILYLYTVLNGNNELVKIRFADRNIMYTMPTGVAPYGVSIVRNKAYVTNWASPLVTDTLRENAGTPWSSAYTDPRTGATNRGTISVIDIENGKLLNELPVGLHPTAIIKSGGEHYLYVANGNSDYVSVVDIAMEKVVDSIPTGLFSKQNQFFGSTPNALTIDAKSNTLYVANGMDNAIAVVRLTGDNLLKTTGRMQVIGYIPTEAYPSGIVKIGQYLFVTNLEAKGARVLSDSKIFAQPVGKSINAFAIHHALASLSIIKVPAADELKKYTEKVKKLNLFYRTALANKVPRKNILPKPLPERIGEPSVFKHVVYVIKENKTYDQVFGDLVQGRGDKSLCVYGEKITPNQHKLATDFSLLDNYYASGKSSAEGHQWTDAAMVSDYVERNVRAWFRSYPHRQEDALVYNKNGLSGTMHWIMEKKFAFLVRPALRITISK